MDCIFCKIIAKENPAEIVYEDKDFLAFKDAHPKADTHLLIIPKKHIESIKSLKQEEADLIGRLILTAKKIAEEKGLSGYKLVFNVGREGGQIIDHIHLHLLAGRIIELV
jgi:histidine triad (HIT) family protein